MQVYSINNSKFLFFIDILTLFEIKLSLCLHSSYQFSLNLIFDAVFKQMFQACLSNNSNQSIMIQSLLFQRLFNGWFLCSDFLNTPSQFLLQKIRFQQKYFLNCDHIILLILKHIQTYFSNYMLLQDAQMDNNSKYQQLKCVPIFYQAYTSLSIHTQIFQTY
ncbi:hypothetical protein ABPG72_017860 [Tetrahymena utriculariae]